MLTYADVRCVDDVHDPGKHVTCSTVPRLEGTHGRGGVTMCANKKIQKTCIIKSQVNSVNSVHCTLVCLRVSCLFLLQEYAGKVRSLWSRASYDKNLLSTINKNAY